MADRKVQGFIEDEEMGNTANKEVQASTMNENESTLCIVSKNHHHCLNIVLPGVF